MIKQEFKKSGLYVCYYKNRKKMILPSILPQELENILVLLRNIGK